MPVTRRRAAAAAPVVVVEEDDDDERATAIDISSDSEQGSEPSSEEDNTSDEDFVEISDSDSDASGGEGGGDESEEEAEAEQLGEDRSEAACSKIAALLRSGRSLEGIKLVECKAYLKKTGLSQTGDVATCVDRMLLHWRFKNENPESIYPRSSFCINCKGDVCKGDSVLFKQKVYDKSGKRHAKCIGKRIVAGKVIKESYGKEKQQHTFTIQVFWSKGVGKLPPLHLLLVKGRNLYRMMTFRQPWPNEGERLKALEEKHNRGDAARRVRSLNRNKSAGNTRKGKKTLGKGNHRAWFGRSDCESNATEVDKGKKRSAHSSNFDLPNKRSKKGGCQLPPTGKKCTGGRRSKKNHAYFDKSNISNDCHISQYNGRKNSQKSCHLARLNTEVGICQREPHSGQNYRISRAQFEGRSITLAPHGQANHIILAGIHHPFVERHQRQSPLCEVGNIWLPHPDGSLVTIPNRSNEIFNTTMGFQHRNATVHAPLYFGRSSQGRIAFRSSDMRETLCHSRPEVSNGVPHFRYPKGSAGFHR